MMPYNSLNALRRNERATMINQKVYVTIFVNVYMPFYVAIADFITCM